MLYLKNNTPERNAKIRIRREGKMLWNAKNGLVRIGSTEMSYVSFGQGKKTLIVLPGLSDGLTTVKGKAILLARPYSRFLEQYTIYMFSRKDAMPDNYSIRNMAEDQAEALRMLELGKVSVLGVSEGGMISLFLAADHAEMVEKLVVAVSAPRANTCIQECVGRWVELAKQGNHKQLMIDTAERCYSEAYLKKYRNMYPLLGHLGRPADYSRFLINANAILSFNAASDLDRIVCPAFIIGGAEDRVVGIEASFEMKDQIANSELYVYDGLGHAVYEEADDFYERIFSFLESA